MLHEHQTLSDFFLHIVHIPKYNRLVSSFHHHTKFPQPHGNNHLGDPSFLQRRETCHDFTTPGFLCQLMLCCLGFNILTSQRLAPHRIALQDPTRPDHTTKYNTNPYLALDYYARPNRTKPYLTEYNTNLALQYRTQPNTT